MAEFPYDKPPFQDLTPALRSLLQATVMPLHFEAGDPVLTPEMQPEHLMVMASGHVELVLQGEPVAVLGVGELFGARAVLSGRCNETWMALDEVHAWGIPRATLQTMVGTHAGFCSWLFSTIAKRLAGVSTREEGREFLSLMMARVQDAFVRKPFHVDGGQDLVTVCRAMRDAGQTNALVDDGDRLGMFTTTDLRDALLLGRAPNTVAVREVSQFNLVSVQADAELFEAWLLMLRHRVHRVLVREGAAIVGVLSQLDLMSFVSNHSHLIALQVEQAASLAELKAAAQQVDGLIEVLHGGGVKVSVISGLVRVLNEQIFARLWGFVAPPELVANSCLIVMGSEGRGEQILKTDQDNALLLRDGFSHPGLDEATQAFSHALIDMGYPPCPGGIMLTNAPWCASVSRFRETLRDWLYGQAPDATMHLAIFMDAAAVAGDERLLQETRAALQQFMHGNDTFLARFASAADQFKEPPSGWWARLTQRRTREAPVFDLKKLGTFPVVHGVRALALEHGLQVVSTADRLHALVQRQVLEPEVGRDLLEALHFLMGCKLKHNLAQRRLGQGMTNQVAMSELGALDRDQLREALAIIKRFRQWLAQHYRLEAL
jgi:CBS domain-containing protein